MTVRTELLLAFLAGVDLTGLGALVKISAELTALGKARRKIETLLATAHDRQTTFQWPTSEDIDRYAGTLGRGDRPRLIARHLDAALKLVSPYEVFVFFLRKAARRRRRLAVAGLLIAAIIAEVGWIIWRLLSR